MTTEVVRGDGNAPGQNPGEAMPSVQTQERGGISDFQQRMQEANKRQEARAQGRQLPSGTARAPANQQTASSRIGAFSEALESKQEQPTAPGEARQLPNTEIEDPGTEAEGGEVPEAVDEAAAEGAQAAELDGEIDPQTALEKFKEWKTGDMFPDELLDKLHEVKVNGQMRYVDGKELRQGYMRGADYYQKSEQWRGQVQNAENYERQVKQYFEMIRDPDHMLEAMERNGYGETLLQVARKLADRVAGDKRLVQAAAIAAMHQYNTNDERDHRVQEAIAQTRAQIAETREAAVERRRLKYEREQHEQTLKRAQSESLTQQHHALYERQLNQLRPNAFRAYGIKDTAGNKQALNRHIAIVLQTDGFSGNLTRDVLMKAAQNLKEEQDDRIAHERSADGPAAMSPAQWKAAQARQGGRALPPGRMATGGGKPLGGAQSKAGSLSDLEAMVKKSRFG